MIRPWGGCSRVEFQQRQEIFSLLQNIQPDCDADSASYWMGTMVLSQG